MSEHDILLLKTFVLVYPLLVVLAAAAAVWIGDLIDRRESRRQAAE
jgi:hypothetical protein